MIISVSRDIFNIRVKAFKSVLTRDKTGIGYLAFSVFGYLFPSGVKCETAVKRLPAFKQFLKLFIYIPPKKLIALFYRNRKLNAG